MSIAKAGFPALFSVVAPGQIDGQNLKVERWPRAKHGWTTSPGDGNRWRNPDVIFVVGLWRIDFQKLTSRIPIVVITRPFVMS
ncbi:hypothetical protein [Bradyrhizobium sp. RDI18]|uniref:hypothetical protein n=1 Tax=Bradyrhizobium sp. RDI18 TaxID=3367400 RepID=UPI00371368A6